MITLTPRTKTRKIQHYKDLPVATPEILIYSEIADRLYLYKEQESISTNELTKRLNLPKTTVIDVLNKKQNPKSIKVALTFMIFFNIDIDNFGYKVYTKHSKYYPIKYSINDIHKFFIKGLKRNLMYRIPIYKNKKEFANKCFVNHNSLYNFINTNTKNISVRSAANICIYIKKNFKRIIYDGLVHTQRFNPF